VAGKVLIQRPSNVDAFGTRTGPADDISMEAFATDFRLATRYGPERTYPIARLTEDGIDWGRWPGPQDEVGYGMDPHRTDDCLQAAIATATQISIEEVPDFALDRRLKDGEDPTQVSRSAWERLDAWATRRGRTLRVWDSLPLHSERWIGVCRSPYGDARYAYDGNGDVILEEGRTHFNDHALNMSYDRLVFDPACSVKVPPGTRAFEFTPEQIIYGITLNKED
jgi:hypothetical protein